MSALERYKRQLGPNDELERRFIALVEDRIHTEDLGDVRNASTRDYLETWATVKLGSVPRSLLLLWNKAKKSMDPEWGEYQRLKEKFNND